MDHQNKCQNTAENELIKSVDSTISSAGMDPKELADEENQKSKAESQENKKGNSNQLDGHSLMEMDSEIGKKPGKIEEEMDGLNQQKEVGKMIEENIGLLAQDGDADEEGIFFPNWLIEALEWIDREEMADSKLSTSSWAFNELCGPKLHGREAKSHFVKWMRINGNEDESGILQAEMRDYDEWPLPNVPPPDYILGFKEIDILYLDARVLEFLNCIASKLNDIILAGIGYIDEFGTKQEDKQTAMFDSLLNMLANKISQFEFNHSTNFAKFNQLFPGFIDQLDSLSIYLDKGIDVDVLYKWLTNRNEKEGSKQKILELQYKEEFQRDFFLRVGQEFSKAIGPVNFLINFTSLPGYHFHPEEFTRENEKTGEVLVSYLKQIGHRQVILLFRCPKGEEERWKEEGEKKLAGNRKEDATSLHVVHINRGIH